MAKYEVRLSGNFEEFLAIMEKGILDGSISATKEDGSDFSEGEFRCAVRVFERYSVIGSNRVSLNLTMVGKDEQWFLSAITSGGSQAVLFKINTFGEEAFLDKLVEIVEGYQKGE